MRLGVVAAMALLAVIGCAGPSASSAPVLVVLADFKIEPSSMTARGPTVNFSVMSNGPTPHNFTIRDASGARRAGTEDLSTNDSTTLTAELADGEYTFFCALEGHESLGMRGTLSVTGP